MKTKAHYIYKTSSGKIVPGVTTISGQLDKPALLSWANRIGLEGYELNKYVDDLANVGELAHKMVSCYFSGEKVDTDDYTKKEISRAKNAFKSFKNWVSDDIEVILHEKKIISDKLLYGGTPDLLVKIKGKTKLIDFKTGSGIYDEYFIQLAGYALILEEKKHKIDEAVIVRIGRTPSEGFETKSITREGLQPYCEIFKNLLRIYYLKKSI